MPRSVTSGIKNHSFKLAFRHRRLGLQVLINDLSPYPIFSSKYNFFLVNFYNKFSLSLFWAVHKIKFCTSNEPDQSLKSVYLLLEKKRAVAKESSALPIAEKMDQASIITRPPLFHEPSHLPELV